MSQAAVSQIKVAIENPIVIGLGCCTINRILSAIDGIDKIYVRTTKVKEEPENNAVTMASIPSSKKIMCKGR